MARRGRLVLAVHRRDLVARGPLGLLVRNPEAASGFSFFVMFLPYVCSAFVPADTMPGWLHGFAEHQPSRR